MGGSGLAFELANTSSVSGPFTGFNLPAALQAITEQLPLGFIISVLFLVLTTLFVATTGDSMTYAVSMVMTGTGKCPVPSMFKRQASLFFHRIKQRNPR